MTTTEDKRMLKNMNRRLTYKIMKEIEEEGKAIDILRAEEAEMLAEEEAETIKWLDEGQKVFEREMLENPTGCAKVEEDLKGDCLVFSNKLIEEVLGLAQEDIDLGECVA